MKSNKMRTALLGIATCAAVSYAVTKSDISRKTDSVAGASREVSNSAIDLHSLESNQLAAWKIFQWKIWGHAGDVAKGAVVGAAGAVGSFLGQRYLGGTKVSDVTADMREDVLLAQREAMLDELN